MAFTEEQQQAITKRGENIIVSAGAGSGKTAVLSERILDFCKKGGDIRRVLVLTFTKAAAEEMKERIRKKLLDNHLFQMAEYIDSAYITTFDSYSLSMVSKYYYLLDLEKNVSIMDKGLISIMKEKILRGMFSNYYQNEDKDFYRFLKKYTTQDDKSFFQTVLMLSDKLDLIVDLTSYINDYEKTYLSKEAIENIYIDYISLINDLKGDILISLEDLLEVTYRDPRGEKISDYAKDLYDKLKSSSRYEDIQNTLANFKFPVVKNLFDETKEAKDLVSKLIKDFKKDYLDKYHDFESIKNEILDTKDDILFLLQISKELLDNLMAYKKSQNRFDFMDIAKMLIELVKSNEEVRKEISNSYDEILVDEYQDTSNVQEIFLSLIENHNRYMVGDIKQGIYRFRNANPYIFKDKYEKYGNHIGGYKIDLTYNFRSRSEVLSGINLIFNKLMTNKIGDADYEKYHQMHYGQKDYDKVKQNVSFNLESLRYENIEELKDFTQAEKEAFIIAKDIKERIDSNVLVYNKETKEFDKVSYKDFAVLISTSVEFVTFKKVFEYLNLPVQIEASLDLKDSILPVIYKNLLMLIALTKKKDFSKNYYHYLASLARSFLYEYSDNDIYELVVNHKEYDILHDIEYFVFLLDLSYVDLFNKMNERLNIYLKLAKIGDSDSSLIILDNIRSQFELFEDLGFDIIEASNYLEALLGADTKLEYKEATSKDDAIRIMTIHKSKGLEFAYCYFPLLTKGFNEADIKAKIGLSEDYGIFIPFVDGGESNLITRCLYQEKTKLEDVSEKVRLFYVALTRAREKMILVYPHKEYKHLKPSKFSSFAEMLEYINVLAPYEREIDLTKCNITNYNLAKDDSCVFTGKKVIIYQAIDDIKKLEKKRISKEMKSLPDKKQKDSIALGIEFHKALESLDFKNPEIDKLPIDDFMKDSLKDILALDIFKNIKEAKTYHELEFYFKDNLDNYHGVIDLLVIYEDHIDIIDYKLSNLDSEEYKRQLSIYKKYVKSISNLDINLYLLSILKKEVKKIEIS